VTQLNDPTRDRKRNRKRNSIRLESRLKSIESMFVAAWRIGK